MEGTSEDAGLALSHRASSSGSHEAAERGRAGGEDESPAVGIRWKGQPRAADKHLSSV